MPCMHPLTPDSSDKWHDHIGGTNGCDKGSIRKGLLEEQVKKIHFFFLFLTHVQFEIVYSVLK